MATSATDGCTCLFRYHLSTNPCRAHQVSCILRHAQVHIAQRHLLPKLLVEHGLSDEQLGFPREVLEAVASGWTREAGVRRLAQVSPVGCFPSLLGIWLTQPGCAA